MAKYTREQIESKLDKVFDSVMQTKKVELSTDTTITPDDGYLGLKQVSVKVKGGSGAKSNYKYYDCLMDSEKDIEHNSHLADNMKVTDIVTGETVIGPEIWIETGNEVRVVAVAYDMSKKIYMDGEWMDIKDYVGHEVDLSAHPEITEEEFYHIPEEEVWEWNTAEEGEVLYNKLMQLINRYGAENIDWIKGLPITPWFKSLRLIDSSPSYNGSTSTQAFSINTIRFTDSKQVWGEMAEAISFDEYGEYVFFKVTKNGKTYYKLGDFTS